MKKICVFGGTFNPVHEGHKGIVKEIAENSDFDQIIVVPSGNPPHKNKDVENGIHRLKMLHLSMDSIPNVIIDDFELSSSDLSYTYKTIFYLKEKYPESKLYFLCGGDNLKQIALWKNPHLIFKFATLIVYKRPGFVLDEADISYLKENYHANIEIYHSKKRFDVSSEKVRQMIKNNEDLSLVLDKDVFDYIKRYNLYKEVEG